MIILIAGSIAVAALVGWALTRSVEPAPPAAINATPTPGEMPPTATSAATTTVTPSPGNTAATPPARAEEGVPRVEPEQLKDLADRGAVMIVDVRDSIAYTTGHIPGAIHIPFNRVEAEASKLPKNQPIITYCT